MRKIGFLAFVLSLQFLCTAQETYTYIAKSLYAFPGPQAYKVPKSGTLLYVETDGQHLAAISGEGKLLWNRDPLKDAHVEFYRSEKPQVVYLGPVSKQYRSATGEADKFVMISYNNSQFGLLRISDGEFKFLGQD